MPHQHPRKRALVLSGGGSKGKLRFLTKEMLSDLHWNQEKSLAQIARDFGVHGTAVSQHARKLGVPTRNSKDASTLANTGEKNPAKRPEVRAKLSGENNHFYGKTHTEDAIQKITNANSGKNHNMYGKRHSEQTLKKMSDNNSMKREDVKEKHRQSLLAVRDKFSGSNSPRWKGGRTDISKQIRMLSEYKHWRLSVYQRDQFTCVFCNSKSKKLNADHIKPFSVLLTEHFVTTVQQAIECLELWDIQNGRTLCVDCHQATDTFGTKLRSYKQHV